MCNTQEKDVATKLLAALGSTEADEGENSIHEKPKQLRVQHLLGMLKMNGNITVQMKAAEQLAQEVWEARNHEILEWIQYVQSMFQTFFTFSDNRKYDQWVHGAFHSV